MQRDTACFFGLGVAVALGLASTAGCRTDLGSSEPPEIVRVSPASVSLDGAWKLFDRSISSSYVPAGPVRLTLDRSVQLSAIKVYGAAPYRLRIEDGSGASLGFDSIDLSKLAAGWNTLPSDALVSASKIDLTFEPLGAPAAIPEIELWAVDDQPTQTADLTADELPDGYLRINATEESTDISPAGCASFSLAIGRPPSQFRHASLVYDAQGLFRAFELQRAVNGFPGHGGAWLGGDGTSHVFVDQIDPATLQAGENQVQLCVPANATRTVTVANLRFIGELDRGDSLVATRPGRSPWRRARRLGASRSRRADHG